MATFLKYFTVFALSTLKFILGPSLGLAYKLPLLSIILLTSLGMMFTVYLFTFFGATLRKVLSGFTKKKKKFTKKNRQFVKLWNTYGLIGVCFLTPLILTPPGGAILVNLLEKNKKKIITWMWLSALGWSTLISLFLKYAVKLLVALA